VFQQLSVHNECQLMESSDRHRSSDVGQEHVIEQNCLVQWFH